MPGKGEAFSRSRTIWGSSGISAFGSWPLAPIFSTAQFLLYFFFCTFSRALLSRAAVRDPNNVGDFTSLRPCQILRLFSLLRERPYWLFLRQAAANIHLQIAHIQLQGLLRLAASPAPTHHTGQNLFP